MNGKIKLAFDEIHASEALKQATRQALHQRLQQRRTTIFSLPFAARLAVAASLLLMLFVGHRLYFTPTSVISIDINPSLELAVNRFDRVIDATGFNADGIQLLESIKPFHRPYTQAVEDVLNSAAVMDCLAWNELLSIAVVESDVRQGQEILDYVSACTAQSPNTACYCIRQEDVEQAHTLGLSYGKYQAYLELRTLLPDITPEQIASMTMREIRALVMQSDNGSAKGPLSSGQRNGKGAGNGRRAGKSNVQ